MFQTVKQCSFSSYMAKARSERRKKKRRTFNFGRGYRKCVEKYPKKMEKP